MFRFMKMELPARAWSAADNITWPEQEQPRDCSVKEEHRPAGNLYTGGTGFGYLRQQHQPSSCLPRPPTMAQRINRKLQQKCRFFPHFTVPYFKHKVCFHQMVFRRHELLPDLQPTQIPQRWQAAAGVQCHGTTLPTWGTCSTGSQRGVNTVHHSCRSIWAPAGALALFWVSPGTSSSFRTHP